MRKVVLYGELGRRFGKFHSFAVRNAAEAIRALRANFAGFEEFLLASDRAGVGFRVSVGHHRLEGGDELHHPSGSAEVIRLVPVVSGAKSPFFRIITGAILIAAAIFVPGLGQVGLSLALVGSSMVVGGVSQLLTKPPPTPAYSESQKNESSIFSGPVNTSVQGSPVTLVYGRMIVGSKVISAGIEAYEQ